MADPGKTYWLTAATACGLTALTLGGIAATLHGSSSARPYWTSGPACVAYCLAAVAVIFFAFSAYGLPFPGTGKAKTWPRVSFAGPADVGDKAPPRQLVSELREALDVHSRPRKARPGACVACYAYVAAGADRRCPACGHLAGP